MYDFCSIRKVDQLTRIVCFSRIYNFNCTLIGICYYHWSYLRKGVAYTLLEHNSLKSLYNNRLFDYIDLSIIFLVSKSRRKHPKVWKIKLCRQQLVNDFNWICLMKPYKFGRQGMWRASKTEWDIERHPIVPPELWPNPFSNSKWLFHSIQIFTKKKQFVTGWSLLAQCQYGENVGL